MKGRYARYSMLFLPNAKFLDDGIRYTRAIGHFRDLVRGVSVKHRVSCVSIITKRRHTAINSWWATYK